MVFLIVFLKITNYIYERLKQSFAYFQGFALIVINSQTLPDADLKEKHF